MNLTQLTDTIADLKNLRSAIDPAIQHLERAVAALKALGVNAPEIVSTFTQGKGAPKESKTNGHRTGSHLDNVLRVLQNASKPLHINVLASEVSQLTGKRIERASVEGAISRHIRQPGHPKIKRVGPGMFEINRDPVNLGSDNLYRSETPTRKDIVADYLQQHGPMLRKDILANTEVPEGTIGYVLNDKDRFHQLKDGRWDIVRRAETPATL
jgi:hypothetical protein